MTWYRYKRNICYRTSLTESWYQTSVPFMLHALVFYRFTSCFFLIPILFATVFCWLLSMQFHHWYSAIAYANTKFAEDVTTHVVPTHNHVVHVSLTNLLVCLAKFSRWLTLSVSNNSNPFLIKLCIHTLFIINTTWKR